MKADLVRTSRIPSQYRNSFRKGITTSPMPSDPRDSPDVVNKMFKRVFAPAETSERTFTRSII